MWEIIFIIIVQSTHSSGAATPPSVAMQKIGNYDDIKTCNLIASQLTQTTLISHSNSPISMIQTAKCVQVKDSKK